MKITSLIVTYNRCEKLQATLIATLKLPFETVVVVNNHSTDGTSELLAEQTDPRLYIINAEVNRGGAAGFAIGAEYIANNLQADWVVFYDDDAFPDHGFIDCFNEVNSHEYSVYCSRVIDKQKQVCRMNIPWLKAQNTFTDSLKYLRQPQDFLPDENQVSEVVTFSFVGCIISHEVLKKTYHLIDKDIFIYFDDVFYSYKLHLSGVKILYHPKLLMHHDINASAKEQLPPWKIYYLVRNMILSRYIFKGTGFFCRTAISLRVFKYLINSVRNSERQKSLFFLGKAVTNGILNKRDSI